MILTDLHTLSSQATDYLIALAQTWLRIPRRSYAASELLQDMRDAKSIDEYWDKRWIAVHRQQDEANLINLLRLGVPYITPSAKIGRGEARVTSMQRKVVRS